MCEQNQRTVRKTAPLAIKAARLQDLGNNRWSSQVTMSSNKGILQWLSFKPKMNENRVRIKYMIGNKMRIVIMVSIALIMNEL